jgi:hypothetical protein
MGKRIEVDEDDLTLLLDCFEACSSELQIERWCAGFGYKLNELRAAEERLRKAVNS